MNILLTGATGFLGYRTLEKLVAQPHVHRIVATGRKLLAYRRVDSQKVHYVLGSLEDEGFVREITRGADAIVNTASLSAPWGSRRDFLQANVHTQKHLIHAARLHGVSRFVYISSPSIYYNGRDRIGVLESDPLPSRFANAYALTKHMAERDLLESGLPHVILRPRALIGRGDSIIMPRLIRAFDAGKLRIIGHGRNRVDLTSVSNAADAILLALHAGDGALHQAYNITNGEPVMLWDHIAAVLAELGRPMDRRKLPVALVDLVAWWSERWSEITTNQEPPLTRYGVGTLARSFTLDIEKARTLLGYQPAMDTSMAMREFIDWYRDHEEGQAAH